MRAVSKKLFLAVLATGVLTAGGCGEDATFLNPAFVNYSQGGVIPLTPGAASSFVLVRLVNRTDNAIEFILTVEREAIVDPAEDVGGLSDVDEAEVRYEQETFRLSTFPGGLTNEIGILLQCPVVRVGLGENLNFPTQDPGLYIGVGDLYSGQIVQGFGVPAGVNPLDSRVGNFACGDTLIFEVTEQTGVPGNVQVKTFVLPAATQPDTYTGPDTFNNARILLERQFGDEE
ncbi:MAG: hypothetical protein JSV19_03770 [Phycisphaerales bacterium]|nr:MAG: hypothetical protein JSV19_03770 [Phycisphaerales bacterium]